MIPLFTSGVVSGARRRTAPALVGFFATRPSAVASAGVISGFDTPEFDDGNFDASTGRYTVPLDGNYIVISSGYPTGGLPRFTEFQIEPLINGAARNQAKSGRSYSTAYTHGAHLTTVRIISLTAGDTIDISCHNDNSENTFFGAFLLPTGSNAFSLQKLGATHSGTYVTNYDNELVDEASAADPTTGVWTCPEDGYYYLSFGFFPEGASPVMYDFYAVKNAGGTPENLTMIREDGGSPNYGSNVHSGYLGFFSVGDTVQIENIDDASGDYAQTGHFSGFMVKDQTNVFRGEGASNETLGNNLTFTSTPPLDLASAWDNSTGVWTCPASGLYMFNFFSDGVESSGDNMKTSLIRNSDSKVIVFANVYRSSLSYRYGRGAFALVECSAGETFHLVNENHVFVNDTGILNIARVA